MLNKKLRFLFVTLLAASACSSPRYRYVPASNQVNMDKRHSEAVYSIPEGRSEGTVKILTDGIVDLKSKSENNKQFPAIHIHMSISNLSGMPWTIEANNQVIAFPNQGQRSAIFANSNAQSLPSVTIPAGALRVIDLYFELPDMDQSAKDVPEFDFRWEVRTASSTVSNSTPFDRVAIPERRVAVYPYEEPVYVGVGIGTVWWGRPGYQWRR